MSTNQIEIAFIADDIKNLNNFGVFHNTTFGLMLAARELNAKILLTESNNLKIINNRIVAKLDEVILRKEVGNHLIVKNSSNYFLDDLKIIFARKDPPINESFLSYIQMLSLIPHQNGQTLILNSPEGILTSNEKLYVFNTPQYLPPTLVTSDREHILSFLQEYKEVVIKPIFNKGGDGVFCLRLDDLNLNSIIEISLATYKTIIVQKYLPEVVSGDKRIILLNGEPLGGITRIPKEGEFRAHISRGASFKPLILSNRDVEICKALKPFLIRDGLFFVAIDLIGDFLIEVNFTCPANLREVGEACGKDLTKEVISWAVETI